uniref:Uncharacterized protein n=1 Tax=Steinernema glaseri TaxID=37863 RepID=A0A1I7YTC7_9BILA
MASLGALSPPPARSSLVATAPPRDKHVTPPASIVSSVPRGNEEGPKREKQKGIIHKRSCFGAARELLLLPRRRAGMPPAIDKRAAESTHQSVSYVHVLVVGPEGQRRRLLRVLPVPFFAPFRALDLSAYFSAVRDPLRSRRRKQLARCFPPNSDVLRPKSCEFARSRESGRSVATKQSDYCPAPRIRKLDLCRFGFVFRGLPGSRKVQCCSEASLLCVP